MFPELKQKHQKLENISFKFWQIYNFCQLKYPIFLAANKRIFCKTYYVYYEAMGILLEIGYTDNLYSSVDISSVCSLYECDILFLELYSFLLSWYLLIYLNTFRDVGNIWDFSTRLFLSFVNIPIMSRA